MTDPIAAHQYPVNIEDEMKRSYMDYAMSVIIGRALPDARDGLKPAHRRVLYGMKTMGLTPTRGYRKCAKIVGEVMGNFHPHGDASIYDTLVRMAQNFNMRYPLVDGQGNYGSVDGDPPAAMRYTEARLEALADDMQADLDKETVDFAPNYDETTEEPTVLPAPFPNLLVNGAAGIAVGMATNVPPHNLHEVVDGCIWLIEHTHLGSTPGDDVDDVDAAAAAADVARVGPADEAGLKTGTTPPAGLGDVARVTPAGEAGLKTGTTTPAGLGDVVRDFSPADEAGLKTGTTTPAGLGDVVRDFSPARGHSRAEKLKHLIELIPGPDFPTGGFIIGRGGIAQAYATGRGSIMMRARTSIESNKKGDKVSILVTEIPYQVNKKSLIERIADLVREKTIEGISDLRDESDREGMRIVIELKRGEVPEVILNNLYKHTPLQSSFGIIMLAIVGGRPKVLNLLELVETFVEFRREVVRRRTEFELRKAEARYHILEGLKIALDQLDAVITLIRGSKTPPEARDGLIANFRLSRVQAQAILDMQLQRLTGLERQKILDELAELLETIERLRAILASERLLMQIIVDELRAVKTKYGDSRRTEIIEGESSALSVEDLIAEEDMAITVTNTGYIKRTAISTYRNQRRGGKGRIGMRTRDEDFVSHLFVASTHAYIMIFSDRGRAYWLKVHEVPDVGPGGKGKAIANLVSMKDGERIAAMLAVKEFETDKVVVMGTRKGEVKKTSLSGFSNPRAGGINAMDVEEGDAVIAVQVTDGKGGIFIGTGNGMAIRFEETEVRPKSRSAGGVRGITLRDNDYVVAMEAVRPTGTLLTVTERGYGKRTELEEYTVQSRGGIGLINISTSARNGKVVGIAYVEEGDEVLLITQQGMIIRTPAKDVSLIGRGTQGVRLIEMEGEDKVVSVVRLVEKEEEE
ncbi:MAG: DNA gyrase subunit A [Acidobacteria bacterium RIFCSPLOWO2_02_FULL_65_29]|nr:MAG: DNA gyrase subunit A [Acidobacteria bacterium RIFCSPLOWO2_02_FULL_65_29]